MTQMRDENNQKTPINTKDLEIAVLQKYISNFWSTFEMSLVNCEFNLSKPGLKICYFVCKWSNNICNNRYKSLYSGGNFINSR